MTPEEWKDAAIADGWASEQLYKGCTGEAEKDLRLTKDGFVAQVYFRKRFDTGEPYERLYVWGPDKLAINPPVDYDWKDIQDALSECMYCEKINVKTQRVGFAGRSCKDCLPEQRRKQEYRGWTN